MIEIQEIKKVYDTTTAVDGVSFEIYEGEVLCILGPNGAGKSTLINILVGIAKQTSGKIFYNGKELAGEALDYRMQLGVVPQEIALYEDLSAMQNIKFFASLYGLSGNQLTQACDEALAYVSLEDRKHDRVKTFSGGMKRRLNIACAIAHNPAIIVMDEPTVGIDPQSRNKILETIKMLRDEGKTILYTTHYMEEVEEIADRIIIMDHGVVIATGTTASLKESMKDIRTFNITLAAMEHLDSAELYRITGINKVNVLEAGVHIESLMSIENLDQIIAELVRQGCKILSVQTESVNLEHVFLDLTGRMLRD